MKFPRWLSAWWKDRPVRFFWQGIPALIPLLGTGVALLYFAGWNPLKVHDRYVAARQRAMSAGDLLTGRIASERLIRVASSNPFFAGRLPEHLYNMAICLNGLGAVRDAAQLLDKVAPSGGESAFNYPPAQLQMARFVWQSSPDRSSVTLEKVERHLLRAATDEPGMEEAHQLLGELYLAMGQYDKAKRSLLRSVEKRGESLLPLALLSVQTRDREAIRQWSNRAQAFYQQRLDANNVEDVGARFGLAQSFVLLSEYEKAVTTLATGFKRTENREYQKAIGGVYANWIAALNGASTKEILEKVKAGLSVDPTNEPLINQLIRITADTGPEGMVAKTTLESMLADGGDNNGVLHFCLGMDALARSQPEQASKHLDLAFTKAPAMPQIANNMAMMLLQQEKPDLERALSIIEPVVRRYPDLPPVLDTRGQILTKLKRWKEAVTDLERAVVALPGNLEIHQALALCYDGLGLPDLAAEHRRRAIKKPPGALEIPPANRPPGLSLPSQSPLPPLKES